MRRRQSHRRPWAGVDAADVAVGEAASEAPVAASPAATALAELNAALAMPDTAAADLKTKLDAYRAAKAKAEQDFAAAQKDLKSATLTVREESALVANGLLN